MDKKDVLSPTVSMGSTYITSVIDAKPGQDVRTCNNPNAFVQTKMDPTEKHGGHIIMKFRGVLVYILSEWTMFTVTTKFNLLTEGSLTIWACS